MSNAKIIAKIKALRARAADAASSENEAAKAAAVADRLLREHNIDLTELDVRADGVDKVVWNPGARMRTPETFCVTKIAKALGIEAWLDNGGEIALLGAPADVEVALYFLDLCHNASVAGADAYERTADFRAANRVVSTRKLRADFRVGVCTHLGQRIADQIDAEKMPAASGTGLVVVKNALINEWMADHDMRFKATRARKVNSSAYGKGKAHAEGVGIGRGEGTQRSGQGLLA